MPHLEFELCGADRGPFVIDSSCCLAGVCHGFLPSDLVV